MRSHGEICSAIQKTFELFSSHPQKTYMSFPSHLKKKPTSHSPAIFCASGAPKESIRSGIPALTCGMKLMHQQKSQNTICLKKEIPNRRSPYTPPCQDWGRSALVKEGPLTGVLYISRLVGRKMSKVFCSSTVAVRRVRQHILTRAHLSWH